jgi:hypothetical protein
MCFRASRGQPQKSRAPSAARPKPFVANAGEKIARLDLDIVARKRAGRWRFLVPPELANPAR